MTAFHVHWFKRFYELKVEGSEFDNWGEIIVLKNQPLIYISNRNDELWKSVPSAALISILVFIFYLT